MKGTLKSTNTALKLVPECSELSSSSTYSVSMGCGRSEGDTAEYTCAPDHRLTSGSTTTTCQNDGSWSDSPPDCELIGRKRVTSTHLRMDAGTREFAHREVDRYTRLTHAHEHRHRYRLTRTDIRTDRNIYVTHAARTVTQTDT